MAPGHNDPFKPDNMLFEGNRLWLVDWEAAFQNDRYADLAVVANMIVPMSQRNGPISRSISANRRMNTRGPDST